MLILSFVALLAARPPAQGSARPSAAPLILQLGFTEKECKGTAIPQTVAISGVCGPMTTTFSANFAANATDVEVNIYNAGAVVRIGLSLEGGKTSERFARTQLILTGVCPRCAKADCARSALTKKQERRYSCFLGHSVVESRGLRSPDERTLQKGNL